MCYFVGTNGEAEVTFVAVYLQGVCSKVNVDREKSILKQGAIQHLYGRLSGILREGVNDAGLLVSCPSPLYPKGSTLQNGPS